MLGGGLTGTTSAKAVYNSFDGISITHGALSEASRNLSVLLRWGGDSAVPTVTMVEQAIGNIAADGAVSGEKGVLMRSLQRAVSDAGTANTTSSGTLGSRLGASTTSLPLPAVRPVTTASVAAQSLGRAREFSALSRSGTRRQRSSSRLGSSGLLTSTRTSAPQLPQPTSASVANFLGANGRATAHGNRSAVSREARRFAGMTASDPGIALHLSRNESADKAAAYDVQAASLTEKDRRFDVWMKNQFSE